VGPAAIMRGARGSLAAEEKDSKKASMGTDSLSRAGLRLARAVSLLGFLVSLIVFLGWAVSIPVLTQLAPGWPRMVALTALAIALTSVSLWLAVPQQSSVADASLSRALSHRRQLSLVLAALVVFIALTRLVAYLAGWDGALLDSLAWHSAASAGGSVMPRMSPATAVGFVLLGGALVRVREAGSGRLHQSFAIAALLIGWLGFARYVLDGVPLVPLSAMALHTALMFMILSVGVLSLRREGGITALLLSEGAGGSSARHLLPAALIIPLAGAALALYSERAGWLGYEAGVSLFALSSVIVFAGIVWVNAAHLERTDQERRRARSDLQSREEHTRLIVDTSLDAVITMDARGAITGWSKQAESLFGWTRQEAIGRSLAQTIVPEGYREPHEQGLRRFLQTGEARVLGRRIEMSALDRAQREFPGCRADD
jgi:PAS domain-containing protein